MPKLFFVMFRWSVNKLNRDHIIRVKLGIRNLTPYLVPYNIGLAKLKNRYK